MTFLPRWFSGAGQKSSVFDFCNIFVGNKFAFETDSNSHSHSDLVSDSDSVNEILKHTETDGCVGRWMLCCYIRPLEFKIQRGKKGRSQPLDPWFWEPEIQPCPKTK